MKLLSSRALRIAPTIPSIIPEGATISAPALAWLTAVFPRISSVGSLRISCFSLTMPQWPWDVYSQRQRSVITIRSSPTLFLIALTAFWTTSSSPYAWVPVSSFSAGIPKIIIAGIPSFEIPAASLATVLRDWRKTPGIELISRGSDIVSSTNIGHIKSLTSRVVSRTSGLNFDERNLLMRVVGNIHVLIGWKVLNYYRFHFICRKCNESCRGKSCLYFPELLWPYYNFSIECKIHLHIAFQRYIRRWGVCMVSGCGRCERVRGRDMEG